MRRLSILLSALLVFSLVGMAVPAAGGVGDNRASLDVDQPEYVDRGVDVERTDNSTIYHVSGSEQTIQLEGVNVSNITDYGVLDGPGSLEQQGEGFHFDPDGQEATTRIFFDVDEGGGSERYVADIRVSDVEWTHLPAGEYDQMQEELSTWESIQRSAESIVPGQDPVETIEDGLDYAAFFDSPLSSLANEMIGTLLMLFWTAGGLVIGGIILALVVIVLAKHYRYKNRTQKQFAELEEMQREKDEAWLQKSRKLIQQCDLNDFFPDHIARAMRDYFGRNTWLAFKQYSLLRSPGSVKGTVLQMMAQVGYVGRVEYGENDNVVDARAVHRSDFDTTDIPLTDGGEAPSSADEPRGKTVEIDLADLEYEDDHDREVIEAIPPEDLDESVFDQEIDASEVSFPIDNREVSDAQLLEELDPSFPGDFEDREQFARCLSELMQFVANHDHTDGDGNVRREMDLLSFLMEMDTILHDEADLPAAYLYQKELLYVAEHMDKGERLAERVETAELDGVGGGLSKSVFDPDSRTVGGD